MSVKEIVANSSTRNICEHLIIVWKFWFRETYDDSNTWNIWCAADLSLNRDISIKLVLIFSHVIFFIKLGKFVTFYDDYDFLAGLEQFYLLEVFLAEIDLFSSCSLMINATGKHSFLVLPQTANVLNCLLSTFRIQNRCNSVWCNFGKLLWWDWAHVP